MISEAIIRRACSVCRPLAARYLVANLAAAGIQSRSGKLKDAVAKSVVGYRKGELMAYLPSGLPTALYKQANALNHGSVHAPFRMSKTIRGAYHFAAARGKAPAGVWTTEGRHFYEFTASQAKTLATMFDEAIRRELQKEKR